MSAVIRFGIPFYKKKKFVCYLNPHKSGVELAFTKGYLIKQNHPLLLSKDRKLVKSIEITDVESIPLELLESLLDEALEIDLNAKREF